MNLPSAPSLFLLKYHPHRPKLHLDSTLHQADSKETPILQMPQLTARFANGRGAHVTERQSHLQVICVSGWKAQGLEQLSVGGCITNFGHKLILLGYKIAFGGLEISGDGLNLRGQEGAGHAIHKNRCIAFGV